MDLFKEPNTIQDFTHCLYQLVTKGTISVHLLKLGKYNIKDNETKIIYLKI